MLLLIDHFMFIDKTLSLCRKFSKGASLRCHSRSNAFSLHVSFDLVNYIKMSGRQMCYLRTRFFMSLLNWPQGICKIDFFFRSQ